MPWLENSSIIFIIRIDFADAKSISYMDYEILQKIKRHRNQRIYRVFCGCFFEFQKIATTPLWKTNFACMFHTRDALARLSYVAVHRFAGELGIVFLCDFLLHCFVDCVILATKQFFYSEVCKVIGACWSIIFRSVK